VPTAKVDPFYADVNDITDLNETAKLKIKHFFNHYKELEKGKWVKTKNFLPKKDALKAIKNGME
jgi:inorganic pyrophosphatase